LALKASTRSTSGGSNSAGAMIEVMVLKTGPDLG
jgi:hypothetical protein